MPLSTLEMTTLVELLPPRGGGITVAEAFTSCVPQGF
jgi:hypothetical protein